MKRKRSKLELFKQDGEELEETTIIVRYDYMIRESYRRGYIQIIPIAPERFLINEETTSIHNDDLTYFVCHKQKLTRSEVQVLLPDVDVKSLSGDDEDLNEEYETRARHAFDGTFDNFGQGATSILTSKVTIVESWIRADYDGDGYAEWRHCFSCGNQLLSNEEWFGPLPFSSFTFFPVPHKFYGLSVYDRIRSYEEAATSLMRSEIDFNRLRNTFRLLAKINTVNKQALQSGKPGVIDVAKSFNKDDVLPVPAPQGATNVITAIEDLRKQASAEVGVDALFNQMSKDIEKSGNDADKTSMALDNANIKMRGYARAFAEGPLRDICWLIAIELVKRKDERFVKNLVKSITPEEPFVAGKLGIQRIINKSDITAKVGLGHQTGMQKIAATNAILPLIKQLEENPNKTMYNLVSNTLIGYGYEKPEMIMEPLTYYQQKAVELVQARGIEMQNKQASTATNPTSYEDRTREMGN